MSPWVGSASQRRRRAGAFGRVQVLGLGLAVSLALAACGGSSSGDSSGNGDSAKRTLKVGVDSDNVMTNMPLYVAIDKGYFKDAGIDSVKVTVTGDQFVSGLVSNSVDISHGSTLPWFAAAKQSGEDLKWLATLRDAQFLQLGVRKGINTPQDLIGKKVTAGPAGSDNEANLKWVLNHLGLKPGQVEIVPTNPGSDAWLAAVIAGKLDGAMLFARHIEPLKQAGGKFLYQGYQKAPQDGFVTTGKFLKEDKATVDAFVKALVQAKVFYKNPQNKDEVVQILQKNGFKTDKVEAAWDQEMGQQSADGGFELQEMNDLVQRGIEAKQIPQGLDWKNFVDLQPLWDAQDAAGLPHRPASLG